MRVQERPPYQTRNRMARQETRTALLFAAPWLIGFSVFMLYPLLASIYYSFCDYSVLRPPVWIGTDNYRGLMHDDVFRQALTNTVI
jgi:multiple sugar transport system permease protein